MYTPADALLTAIDDAQRLVPWIERNADALQWEPLDRAVFGALHRGPSTEAGDSTPLLRFARGDVDPVPLLDAVLNPDHYVPRPGRARFRCDVYKNKIQRPHTFWVPCGASVVQVTVSHLARGILQDLTNNHLVWC